MIGLSLNDDYYWSDNADVAKIKQQEAAYHLIELLKKCKCDRCQRELEKLKENYEYRI